MRTNSKILIVVLVISMFPPLLVSLSSLFYQSSALRPMQISELTPDIERLLLVSGAYMLSFVILFGVAALWIAKGKQAGFTLAVILGIITLLRGILLFTTFNIHGFGSNVLATIGTVDGILILLFAFFAKPSIEPYN